jgi:hypothetical protein
MKYLFISLLINVALMACTSQAAQGLGGKGMKRLEVLHAVNLQKEHIEVTVTGSGCTLAEHFDIQAALVDNVCQVSIYRTRIDRCRRMPMPVSLKLPWDAKKACGNATIEVKNSQKPSVLRR